MNGFIKLLIILGTIFYSIVSATKGDISGLVVITMLALFAMIAD